MKLRRPSMPPRLPADVVDRLAIPGTEKVVAWGSSIDGTFIVATDRAMYADALIDRTPWSRISKASWEEPVLTLTLLDASGRVKRPVRVRIDDSRDLPPAVHDRVTASVVVSERVDLGDGAKALLAARKDSDAGQIRWSVVFDPGRDPSDPALRAAADAALAQLRGSLGI
jgi:hypothetical protein